MTYFSFTAYFCLKMYFCMICIIFLLSLYGHFSRQEKNASFCFFFISFTATSFKVYAFFNFAKYTSLNPPSPTFFQLVPNSDLLLQYSTSKSKEGNFFSSMSTVFIDLFYFSLFKRIFKIILTLGSFTLSISSSDGKFTSLAGIN